MYPPILRELHRSLKPLLYIVKISGLLPNEIRVMNGNIITERSTFGITHSVILIVLYSGIVYYMRKNNIIVMKFDGVSMIIESIQLFAFELIFYILVLAAFIRQKEFLQIIERMSKLDSLLFQLGEEIDYQKEFRRNMIFVGSLCVLLGNIGLVEFYKNYQPGFEYILHLLRWFLPLFLMDVTVLQFVIVIFSVKLRCSKLNNAVSTMLIFVRKGNSNVVPNVEIEHENSLAAIYCNYNIAGTIWNLSVIYDLIYDMCKHVNKVFAYQVTFGLGSTSVLLTFIIYGISTYIKDTTPSFQWGYVVITGQLLLLHVSTIFVIIYCCSEIMSEVGKVAILLHKVKPKWTELREAINTFSLQLMHQKVQFTACGLFNLDYTFIYLLVSTITTYMVILVQFGETVDSQSSSTKME